MELSKDQIEQFTKFGCIARSIMLLAAAKGCPPITREIFCEQFGFLFRMPGMYGGLYTSQIVDVIRPLGLGIYFRTFRRYESIQDFFRNERLSVLVSSEVHPKPGDESFVCHCSLLTHIDEARFSIITPTQNTGDVPVDYVRADWDAKLFHGIVLSF